MTEVAQLCEGVPEGYPSIDSAMPGELRRDIIPAFGAVGGTDLYGKLQRPYFGHYCGFLDGQEVQCCLGTMEDEGETLVKTLPTVNVPNIRLTDSGAIMENYLSKNLHSLAA